MKAVTFKNNVLDMAGVLHLPAGFDEAATWPVIARASSGAIPLAAARYSASDPG